MKEDIKSKYKDMYFWRKEIETEREKIKQQRRALNEENKRYTKAEEDFYKKCKHKLICWGVINDDYHGIEIKTYRYYCPICRYEILLNKELPNVVWISGSTECIENLLEKLLIDDIEGANELFKSKFAFLIDDDAGIYAGEKKDFSNYIKKFGYEIKDTVIVKKIK